MKAKIMILAAACMAMTSCADLGFGVDVDSAGASPYWYGSSGPFYGGYSTGPYFGLDFPLGYRPYSPPIVGNGPGSIFNPAPVRPPRPSRPPYININGSNPGPVLPGGSAVIPGAGSGTRPGNGGLPSGTPVTGNPSSVPTGQPTRGR